MTKMEDDLNGRHVGHPQWKTTSKKTTAMKTTSMRDDLNGIRSQQKTTSIEDDINGI